MTYFLMLLCLTFLSYLGVRKLCPKESAADCLMAALIITLEVLWLTALLTALERVSL